MEEPNMSDTELQDGFDDDIGESAGNLSNAKRIQRMKQNERIDTFYNFKRLKGRGSKTGWLFNMRSSEILNDNRQFCSVMDLYFVEDDGSRFKVSYPYKPYFYIRCKPGTERETATYLGKRYMGKATSVELEDKEDLDLANHLVGLKRSYVKLSFNSADDLRRVKWEISPFIQLNNRPSDGFSLTQKKRTTMDQMENIIELREHDVPHTMRTAINEDINVGRWYDVQYTNNDCSVKLNKDVVHQQSHGVLAFDIETTKSPLKFPDVEIDQIMMISYMIDGHGFLINNREIISEDVPNFEFTPKPEFPGPFSVINQPNEKSTIDYFFRHIERVKPLVIVTYNGDFFDWPFVERRAALLGMNMYTEIGFSKDNQGAYLSRCCVHADALKWVKRDSYLPIGSQGLKAVTKVKLRYDPDELDPEKMCQMAAEEPQILANYSVSDAVATYYLYMKYIHPFIFALCTIIPMGADDVLRKGSGTLCETLLMTQAYKANVVFPNKQVEPPAAYTKDGHLLDAETYVGARVEALESGVFRADIPLKFKLEPTAFQRLVDNLDRIIEVGLTTDTSTTMTEIADLDEVKQNLTTTLENYIERPRIKEMPALYHLDVAAMYPNIILTNRLQPSAIVTMNDCSKCSFNTTDAKCKRPMKWIWRGDYLPASRSELQRIRTQLETERFPPVSGQSESRPFHSLTKLEQIAVEKKRYSDFCRKVYKRMKMSREEEKETVICQRENSFYVDTVRAFRDRRYEYKRLHKTWLKKLAEAEKNKDVDLKRQCHGLIVLYESLQLAHKCILNSFYGYVMRRGARWYSMEMAGIVCYAGSTIITRATKIIEELGRPLELDTDGIWCALPSGFPGTITLKTKENKRVCFSFPCAILNLMMKDHYTNEQYHELVDRKQFLYDVRPENSILFEVDGPYLAMILPAAREEGKKIKKRYCVYNFDQTVAELKGFEVKRNGELELIKIFQTDVFGAFLEGKSLEDSYRSAGKVANFWLEMLYSHGSTISDSDLLDLIAENRRMSRALGDYGSQKSTSISTARKLAEFLGDQIIKDKGLACKFIIAKRPAGAPVTERTIPVAIFQAQPHVKFHYLKKWLRLSSDKECQDIRQLLDWQYYIERLGNCIQKIITIPACMQGITNPVPRVVHPPWLQKKVAEKMSLYKQQTLDKMFMISKRKLSTSNEDDHVAKRTCAQPNEAKDANSGGENGEETTEANMAERGKPKPVAVEPAKPRKLRELLLTYDRYIGDPPTLSDPKVSLGTWISYQKKKWAWMRSEFSRYKKEQRRKAIKDAFLPVAANAITQAQPAHVNTQVPKSGLDGFVQTSKHKLSNCHLQILEVFESGRPGQYHMFAMADSEMMNLKITIDRVFYVDRNTLIEEKSYIKRSSKILPRSIQAKYLYEYSVPEDFFQSNNQAIMSELSSAEVRGVYQLNTPMVFRLINEIGCCCTLDKSLTSIPNMLQIKDLIFRGTANFSYLSANNMPHHAYLYLHRSEKRTFMALASTTSLEVTVVVVDPKTVQSRLPSLAKLYRTQLEKRDAEWSFYENGQTPTFAPKVTADNKPAYRALSNALADVLGNCGKQKCILMLQSNVSKSDLRLVLPSLQNIPIVYLANNEPNDMYKTFDWQPIAAKHFIQNFLNVQIVMNNLLEQSRYYAVPLGNLPSDTFKFACDLFFSRHLLNSGYVLWCSDEKNYFPDLGGAETIDHRTMFGLSENPLSPIGKNTEVNYPDFYTSNCVEFSLRYLSVCALLNTQKVNEREGVDSAISFDIKTTDTMTEMLRTEKIKSSNPSFDESSSCYPCLRILRVTVCCWIQDFTGNKNPIAEILLMTFGRWLCDPTSYLYDPTLLGVIEVSKRKLFAVVVKEFQTIGCQVVHVSNTRMVLNMKRHFRLPLLKAHAMSMVENVCSNCDLLSIIHLSPSKFWKVLLWFDPGSYCGIRYISADHCDATTSTVTQEPQQQPVESKLFMFDRFSDHVRQLAKSIVASYVVGVYEKLTEYNKDQNSIVPIYQLGEPETGLFGEKVIDAVIQLARTQLREHIFTAAFWIQDDLKTDESYSRLASLFQWKYPATEFVRCICDVLAIDKVVESEVQLIRNDVYGALSRSNFHSIETDVMGANTSFVVNQIWCRSCYAISDLDLFKDAVYPMTVKRDRNKHRWICSDCRRPHNTRFIESVIVFCLDFAVNSYINQDFQCRKCQEIQFEDYNKLCQCSGEPFFKQLSESSMADNLLRMYWLACANKLQSVIGRINSLSSVFPTVQRMTSSVVWNYFRNDDD